MSGLVKVDDAMFETDTVIQVPSDRYFSILHFLNKYCGSPVDWRVSRGVEGFIQRCYEGITLEHSHAHSNGGFAKTRISIDTDKVPVPIQSKLLALIKD